MNNRTSIRIILTLSVFAMTAYSGLTQQKPQGQISEDKTPASPKILVTGQIEYVQSEGGYFIRGDHPYGRMFKIANQNPTILEPLLKSGNKHVTVEGILTAGRDTMVIEKIFDQPYPGK